MKNQIGVSLVCGLRKSPKRLLKCLNHDYWVEATRRMKEMGFNFIQGLPLRGITEKTIREIQEILPIRYAERSWNLYSRWLLPFRMTKINKTGPKLEDIILFPRPRISQEIFWLMMEVGILGKDGIVEIAHGIDADYRSTKYLETSPGLWLRPEVIVTLPFRGLVVDLYHLRRAPRDDEKVNTPLNTNRDISRLGVWQESLPMLLKKAKLIHVSPNRDNDELERFIASKPTELEEMLRVIKDSGFNGDYVVEAVFKSWDDLQNFHDRLGKLIE